MKRKAGFTLIELLVVMAIIGILASIVLPGLKRARERSHLVVCTNNLAQIGKALLAYANDNQQLTPPGTVLYAWPCWHTYLYRLGYVDDPDVFACPADLLKNDAANWLNRYAAGRGGSRFHEPAVVSYASHGNASSIHMWNRIFPQFGTPYDPRNGAWIPGAERNLGNHNPIGQSGMVNPAGAGWHNGKKWYSSDAQLIYAYEANNCWTYDLATAVGLPDSYVEKEMRLGPDGRVKAPEAYADFLRHNGNYNVLFLDGHVETIRADTYPFTGQNIMRIGP